MGQFGQWIDLFQAGVMFGVTIWMQMDEGIDAYGGDILKINGTSLLKINNTDLLRINNG